MGVLICPIHLCRMRGHKEATPRFMQTWGDYPATRIVYRCPVKNCPRIEGVLRSFKPSWGMTQAGRHYLDKYK